MVSGLLPPPELQSKLAEACLDRSHLRGLPPLEVASCINEAHIGRRAVLKALAGMGAVALSAGVPAGPARTVGASSPLVFDAPAAQSPMPEQPAEAVDPPRLGEISPQFWQQPRELWLQRQVTGEAVRVVYWRDGNLVPEGYWQVCALLRDVRANRMTTMDPLMLDVLRGVLGYYQAWQWPYPLVITSGFRTVQTNSKLITTEGAAKNSMHLYGKAADLYMPGASVRDIGLLGMHLQQGGVGFYPSKGFTHLDTGRLRTWRG